MEPLATLGHSVQSLLETPDPTTESMYKADKRKVSVKKPCSVTRYSYGRMLFSASFSRVHE